MSTTMPSSDPQAAAQPTAPANSLAPAPATGASKLSGAELKKQAKAEKAARRAQALQEKQAGSTPTSSGPLSGPQQKSEGVKNQKAQHRRTGSTAGELRNLAVRGGAPQSAPAVKTPQKEDKTVEFFRHLYKPRRTTIAGAGKEVHPAVQALGLQMSNYTICGSCARLVATLQAFKRVSCSAKMHRFWRL